MSDNQLFRHFLDLYFCSLLIRMEDVSASNDALMRMYKHLIEIANKTIRDPTSPIEAMFDADACRDVLKSKLSNLIE